MKLKSNQPNATAQHVVKDIKRTTRRHYSTWHSPNSVDKYYFEIEQINFDLTLFIG